MPVDYKLRTLRRLFGAQSFFRVSNRPVARRSQGTSSLGSVPPGSSSEANVDGNVAEEDTEDEELYEDFPKNETRSNLLAPRREGGSRSSRAKSQGGFVQPFFHEKPPRSIRNKSVSEQLNLVHLFEKQKMKVYFGAIRDDKFRKYVEAAKSCRFNVDAELMRMLEMRLDTVLYRTGFVQTPSQARQWICHKQILVNGSPLNIRSAHLQGGDMISIRDRFIERALEASTRMASFREQVGAGSSWLLTTRGAEGMLPWLVIDRAGLAAIVVRPPSDDEVRAMCRAALFPYIRDAQLNPIAAMRYYR